MTLAVVEVENRFVGLSNGILDGDREIIWHRSGVWMARKHKRCKSSEKDVAKVVN